MELVIFLGSLFFFLFLNIPIALVMVLSAIVLMLWSGDGDFMIIPQAMVDGVNNYPLMAIPFFVFAGEIMAKGGLSERVVKLAQLMIGRVRGGLGYATIVASIIGAAPANPADRPTPRPAGAGAPPPPPGVPANPAPPAFPRYRPAAPALRLEPRSGHDQAQP